MHGMHGVHGVIATLSAPIPPASSPEMSAPRLFFSVSALAPGEVMVSRSQQLPASVEQRASRRIRGLRSGSSSRTDRCLGGTRGEGEGEEGREVRVVTKKGLQKASTQRGISLLSQGLPLLFEWIRQSPHTDEKEAKRCPSAATYFPPHTHMTCHQQVQTPHTSAGLCRCTGSSEPHGRGRGHAPPQV